MTKNEEPSLEILLISLESDLHRREKLRERFPRQFERFQFIVGVDLRDPAKAVNETLPPPCPRSARNPLSLPETGCALSHMRALAQVARSAARSVLILEDDVLGDDEAIATIARVTARLPRHHFLLCGGQDGLRGSRYLYGREEWGCFRLPGPVRRFIARACCYAVSPSMASVLFARQQACLLRADEWRALLRGERNVFFSQQLRHPVDLNPSHLEVPRSQAPARDTLRRVWADGGTYTLCSQLLKAALPILGRINRWQKIHLNHSQHMHADEDLPSVTPR